MKPATTALNEAVLHHVLHQIREGNYNACKALGIDEALICKLQDAPQKVLSRLAFNHAVWSLVSVDTPVLTRLLDDGANENQDSMINRALRLGASSKMMMDFFGMSNSDTAQRRRLLKVESRKGRLAELTEAQKLDIWRRWKVLTRDNNRTTDPLSMQEKLDLAMLIAEEQGIVLANVWLEIISYAGAENVC
jgi:hypothetical protein